MKSIEYITEILPDGHLPIPDSVIKKLNLRLNSKICVSLHPVDTTRKGLAGFAGAWQDERDADEIVEQVLNSRRDNTRSESFEI